LAYRNLLEIKLLSANHIDYSGKIQKNTLRIHSNSILFEDRVFCSDNCHHSIVMITLLRLPLFGE
jgi:hypothetical protein